MLRSSGSECALRRGGSAFIYTNDGDGGMRGCMMAFMLSVAT